MALSGFSQAVNHSGKPLRVAVLLVKSEQNGLSALLLCVFMCVRQAACGLLWLWRFMCLPWRAKLCSSTPQSASERESLSSLSPFPCHFPPLIPSLLHSFPHSHIHCFYLSLLFLLSCFCFCLSLHLFLPPSFLACCPGCYQECRNTDVMSRGWKNRQIRFLLWFLRLLTYLRMRG